MTPSDAPDPGPTLGVRRASDLGPAGAPATFDFMAASPHGQIVYTPDLVILDVNARHCAMTGRKREDLIRRKLFEAFPANTDDPSADAEPALRASVARVVETGEPHEMPLAKHDITGPTGAFEERYWQITHSAIREAKGRRVVAILQTLRDVTEAVLREKLIEARRRTAARGGAVASWEYDPESDAFSCSEDVETLFGFAPGTMPPRGEALFGRMHPEDREAVLGAFADMMAGAAGTEARFDYRSLWPDGTVRWIVSRAEVVRAPDTQAPAVVGVMLDVTDLREREAELSDAVKARDVLLAEVNHRVKNSLQIVASMLNVEAAEAGAAGEAGAGRLAAAAARANAVAALHAALYHGEDVRSVDVGAFLDMLCRHVAAKAGAEARGVALDVRTRTIRLATDRAITLSLIANELVAETLERAFEDGRGGTVRVSLGRAEERRIALEVALDGAGDGTRSGAGALGEDDDGVRGSGRRMVAALADQLEAEMRHDEDESGVCIRLVLPLDDGPSDRRE